MEIFISVMIILTIVIGIITLYLFLKLITHNLIKWKYKPSGLCPVQSEGWFMNKYFYFRSRHSTARIEFANSRDDWYDDKVIKKYTLYTTKDPFSAGYFSERFCLILVYIGFFKFLLYNIKLRLLPKAMLRTGKTHQEP